MSEYKQVFMLLLLIMPVFAVAFLYWITSDTYHNIKEAQRVNAQNYLIQTYYMETPECDDMIEHYGFTDNEINPNKIINRYIDEKDY